MSGKAPKDVGKAQLHAFCADDTFVLISTNPSPLRTHFRRYYRSEVTRVWLPIACLLTLLVVGTGVLLLQSQQQARVQLEERFALRGPLASRFVSSYVADLQSHEIAHASRLLSGSIVTPDRFALVSQAFGFEAAVLLDSRGRVLNVVPAKPELVGQRLDQKYAHLAAALAGAPAVSGVVPSAVRAEPIVAFAVPFETPHGRRVFSGGAAVATSPLGPYLANSLPFKNSRAYLIAADGTVMVAGGSKDAELLRPPTTRGRGGSLRLVGRDYRFVSTPVDGTSWRLLLIAPSSQLFAPLAGTKKWIPWLALLAFVLASAVALGLLAQLMRQKAQLAHLATHDPLTGALNRRALEANYLKLAAQARRSRLAVGVLAIDLDHFKGVNDSFGHAVGDDALRLVAKCLMSTLRPFDLVARIGGDEFIVLLADVDEDQADLICERVVRTLEEIQLSTPARSHSQVKCSAGVALADADNSLANALSRADQALYEAKSLGRNQWRKAAA
jgi:diguanylate cyclase (GGDEF)-like protein